MMAMAIKEITVKSILTKSKLPDADYVVNPYTGCAFGCLYCYASFMGRFVNEPIENWGNYVYVKTNAVALFEKELKQILAKHQRPSILLSSVTDPYQGIESKYRLTRGILKILASEPYLGKISVLTKSPLVLRDVDILRHLPSVEVGLTVTTTDDKLSRFLEVAAPPASKRLQTLKELKKKGIETYAFVGPLLPHFRHQPDLLEKLFSSLAEVGVEDVYVEHINMSPYIQRRLLPALRREPEEIRQIYAEASTISYRKALNKIVADLLKKYGLRLRRGEVLDHKKQT